MRVSLDKLHVVARLESNEIIQLKKSVAFTGGNNHYRYTKWGEKHEPHYAILFLPDNMYARRYYNIMVKMEGATLHNMPEPVKAVLRLTNKWKVKRTDIAFDFPTRIGQSFPLVTGNSSVKRVGRTYYLNALSNRTRACCYDKAQEQRERKGLDVVGDWTRFEIRLRPKLVDASLYDWTWAEPMLEQFVWLPNINDLNVTRPQKDTLKKIQRRVKFDWREIPKEQKKILQSIIAESKINFKQILLDNKHAVMSWLWHLWFDEEIA